MSNGGALPKKYGSLGPGGLLNLDTRARSAFIVESQYCILTSCDMIKEHAELPSRLCRYHLPICTRDVSSIWRRTSWLHEKGIVAKASELVRDH